MSRDFSPIASVSTPKGTQLSITSDSVASSSNLLSYPAQSIPEDANIQPAAQPRRLLKDRLYVGNLHPTVDEYTLLQIFSKFGKISKLDYLFHKAGPMKGKPRGYAFIEYSNPDDAARALAAASDKLLRGRKLVVTFAHQAPQDESGAYGGPARTRRGLSEAGKPTTLSLLKSAGSGRFNATEDKIAKMEAKLRQMEKSDSSTSALRPHPSLPPKPVASSALPSNPASTASKTTSGKAPAVIPPSISSLSRPKQPLATSPRPAGGTPSPVLHSSSAQSVSTGFRKGTPSLSGVKIGKHKDRLYGQDAGVQ